MLGTIVIKILANLYYLFIPASMITTFVFDRKYEKYKREKGYKNNYKGTYSTKGLFSGDIIDIIENVADLGTTFLIPAHQFGPLVDLLMFKDSARINLHKEEDSKAIEWVDPSIIDADFKIISEEKVDRKEELSVGEKTFSMEALTMHAAKQMENPDFYDEETQEYKEAVEAYQELYEHYMEEINRQNTPVLDESDGKREPRLK